MVNWFTELSAIDVNDHVKQKGKQRYLSWMWAWSELKKRYPLSYATVHETLEGMLVWKDPKGCHVKTSVTIVWEEDGCRKEHTVTEFLPCMDFKNMAVDYNEVDSMLVNKTIQRSLTKCIARLGIGGYLFMDEDLPEEITKINSLQSEIKELVAKKCSLSEKAKTEVATICKNAERESDPDAPEDTITGDYKKIDNIDILENLKKRLLIIRK